MVYKVPPSEEKTTETLAPTVVDSGESKGSGTIADEDNHITEQLKENVKGLLSSSRKFEASRKTFCDAEAEASTAYWESLKALVKRNTLNIEKCVRYVKCRLEAEMSYAESLYNIQEMVEGTTIDNVQPSAAKRTNKQKQQGTQRRGRSLDRKDQYRGTVTGITAGPGKNATALEHMYWHDTNTANKILDMCSDVEEKALNNCLEKTRIDLCKNYSVLTARGDACFKVLRAHEVASREAFQNLEMAIFATLDHLEESREGSSSNSTLARTTSGYVSPKGNTTARKNDDVWRADCQYKIRASQQLMIREDAQVEMSKLFSGIKNFESIRRSAIQESLTYLVRSYDSLLRDLPLLRDPVLLMLDRIITDRVVLEQYVHNAVGQGVIEQAMEGGGAVESTTEQLYSSNEATTATAEVPLKDLSMKLENPLLSSLLAKLALIQRRKDGMMLTRWTQCLLVATKQNYLYVYDLKKQYMSPEEAFRYIIPVVELNVAIESTKKSQRNPQTIVPNCEENMTLDLSHSYCEVPATESGKDGLSQMTIVEVKKTTGVKTMLRTFNQQHLVLRGQKKDIQNLARFVTSVGTAGVRDAVAQGFLP